MSKAECLYSIVVTVSLFVFVRRRIRHHRTIVTPPPSENPVFREILEMVRILQFNLTFALCLYAAVILNFARLAVT